MQLNNFVQGVLILQKYYVNPVCYPIFCEHDRFNMCDTDVELSAEDYEIMIKLGWFQPEANIKGEYDFSSQWSAYT